MALLAVTMRGQAALIAELVGVSKHARFAHKSALRAAATRARGDTVKALAAKLGTNQKVWRKRVRVFFYQRRRLTEGKLWLGLKRLPQSKDSKAIANAIRAATPDGFEATMPSGHRGFFRRKQPTRPYGPGARRKPGGSKGRGRTPIEEAKLDPQSVGAELILRASASDAMKTRYPEVLRKDFLRRVRRSKARRR